jgi:hypothetical protein
MRRLAVAYTQVIERKKATRYRGFYRDADGRYRPAGTYGTEDRALEIDQEAEKHAAALISEATGGLDPVTRATRTIEEYEPVFLRHHQVEGNTKDTYSGTLRLHAIPFLGKVRLAEMNRTAARNYFTALEEAGRSPNSIRQAKVVLAALFTMAVSDGYLDVNPFHDVRTPKVPGPRAIKIATTDQYLKVRDCLPTMTARVLSTLLISSGLRFCEATGLRRNLSTCLGRRWVFLLSGGFLLLGWVDPGCAWQFRRDGWLGHEALGVGGVGGVQAEAAVAVVVVVPAEEVLAVRAGGLDRAEPGGERRPVFQGLELRFRIRVVVT